MNQNTSPTAPLQVSNSTHPLFGEILNRHCRDQIDVAFEITEAEVIRKLMLEKFRAFRLSHGTPLAADILRSIIELDRKLETLEVA